ncbi:Ku protein [Lysobacter sp. TY2-98]|uniref:non-homologous end joining protein Ku n=1 Tax=Lysobacter sp. TY2-98 TaxID=2290922 RepID=UPI000E1FD90F|nr:Ku protein [Lysobacter sp. TY2-98]AXK71655.1 Ku protein [Lysobacter sp. TY2-98]
MARPIWSGSISFGLLNIPIQLMSGERRTDIHFRMLDSRNNAPIRYERVNAETGEEVPWKEIVKAYEFSKDNYVVLKPEDIERAATENHETIAIESFVDAASISLPYIEKPYILVPGKKAEKGYVLLREVLKKNGRVGIGRVVIRTREYLCMLTPQDDALMLMLMRFPQELVDPADYDLPSGSARAWHVTPKEMQMAEMLMESMTDEFKADDYKDEFRERLSQVIKERIKQKKTAHVEDEREDEDAETATNVVDFMSLLKKSLEKKGGGATKTAAKKATRARKTPAAKPKKRAAKKRA